MGELLLWWLAIELAGLAGLPLVSLVLQHLPDRGWALAKPLSLLLLGWLIWFPLTAISALPYTSAWIVATLLVFAAANAVLLWRLPALRAALRAVLLHHRAYILAGEALFALAFALMAWFRSFTPAVVDTEKFMDVAFLSSLWRAPHLPPPDPWLSGFTINYYYYGHFLLASLAKVLGTQPGTAFNIGIAVIFALAALAIFAVAANLMAALRGGSLRGWPVLAAGIASAVLVLVLGNLNGAQVWWQDAIAAARLPAGGISTPWAWWLHRDLWLGYEWWPPSRVIPGMIDEFPAFSFVLADLHAHVLALPFAALAVGIALNLLLGHGDGVRAFGRGPAGIISLIATAVALGSLYAINGWDLPTYLGLALLALVVQQWLAHDRRLDALFLLDLFSAAVLLIALAFLAYLPFYRGFVSPSQGFGPVLPSDRTPIGYEVAIFGLPLFILGSLVIVWLARSASPSSGVPSSLPARRSVPWLLVAGRALCALLLLWTAVTQSTRGWTLIWCLLIVVACGWLALQRLGIVGDGSDGGDGDYLPDPADAALSTDDPDRAAYAAPSTAGRAELLLLILFATSAALVAICELIFVRDVFNSRMNTVFKLYFQAWLLLGIAAGPALIALLGIARTRLRAVLASLGTLANVAAPAPSVAASPSTATAMSVSVSAAPPRSSVSLSPPPMAFLGRLSFAASPGGLDVPPVPAGASDHAPPADASAGGSPQPHAPSGGPARDTRTPALSAPNLPAVLRWLGTTGILIWVVVLVALVGAASVYPVLASSARTGNFTTAMHTLDGTAYMARDAEQAPADCSIVGAGSNAHDDAAIAWLNTHISGQPVIVEAPGCEWTHYSRVSSFTGLPTLLGWPGGHEGEWRVNWLLQHPEEGNVFADRLGAINEIYTNANRDVVMALLQRYHARLIYVGAAERALYPNADLMRFGSYMRVIYERDGVIIYAVP